MLMGEEGSQGGNQSRSQLCKYTENFNENLISARSSGVITVTQDTEVVAQLGQLSEALSVKLKGLGIQLSGRVLA